MARKPQVRYFESRNAYYTQWKGKQVCLAKGPKDDLEGPTYLAALQAFKSLIEQGAIETAGDRNSVKTIFNAHLAAMETKIRHKSFQVKLSMLSLFVARWGDLRTIDIKPYHADAICNEMKKPRQNGKRVFRWSDSQCVIFLRQLRSAFAWALKQELITRNPILAVEMPSVRSKSRERVITPEEHEQILSVLKMYRQRSIRRIVIALENTGARPSELIEAKVSDFNASIGAIEYFPDNLRREGEKAHKTSRKGKHRVIYFTGETLKMVKELCTDKKATDYIFTMNNGQPYKLKTLDINFRAIRERTNLPHIVPYAYRHTLATRWLKRGESIDYLANLLGNSPEVIRKNYAHLIHEHDTMRAKLEAFRQVKSQTK